MLVCGLKDVGGALLLPKRSSICWPMSSSPRSEYPVINIATKILISDVPCRPNAAPSLSVSHSATDVPRMGTAAAAGGGGVHLTSWTMTSGRASR